MMRSKINRCLLLLACGAFALRCGREVISPTEPAEPHLVGSSVAAARLRSVRLRPAVLPPSCETPAKLTGSWDSRTPFYIVVFRDGTDANLATARLAARYGFTPRFIFIYTLGFSAYLTPQQLAGIRCEIEVAWVEYVAPVFPSDASPHVAPQ